MFVDTLVGFLHHKEKYKGTRLDLAYITPQLIASAMPTDRFMQSFYRTDARKLVAFLNERHPDSWHVWNLQEQSELSYDIEDIGGSGNAVTHVPIPDHRPLPLGTLVKTATSIREYVVTNPSRVALVHCKCGKGRTGSLIVSYLMLFNGMSYRRAVAEFTQKRIRFGLVDGITIKSQQVYLNYLAQWILKGADPELLEPVSIEIVKVVIRNPQVENFELEIQSLDAAPDDTGLGTCAKPDKERPQLSHKNLHAWDMVVLTNRLHVLKPVDTSIRFTADIWVGFKGFAQKAGFKVPTATASFSANVLFEPNMLLATTSELTAAEDAASIVCQLGSGDVSSFTRHWDDTDGLMGLDWHGKRAFDSIEVFWSRANASSSPAPVSPRHEHPMMPLCPPSISTFHGHQSASSP